MDTEHSFLIGKWKVIKL